MLPFAAQAAAPENGAIAVGYQAEPQLTPLVQCGIADVSASAATFIAPVNPPQRLRSGCRVLKARRPVNAAN